MKAIIIDDERLAREELKSLLAAYSNEIKIIGEAKNGIEGIELIEKLSPDIVFLDIQMPEMDGFEMIKKLNIIPKVVFVSAYDEYALDAFKVNALDYLLKPVDPNQLKETLQKLKSDKIEDDFVSNVENERDNRKLTSQDRIFIKDGENCYFPYLQEVVYFESQGNYVKVYFGSNRPMILRSLSALEERISSDDFFRANRKYLINLSEIEEVENWFNGGLKVKLKNGKEIEISRRQTLRFKEIMSI